MHGSSRNDNAPQLMSNTGALVAVTKAADNIPRQRGWCFCVTGRRLLGASRVVPSARNFCRNTKAAGEGRGINNNKGCIG